MSPFASEFGYSLLPLLTLSGPIVRMIAIEAGRASSPLLRPPRPAPVCNLEVDKYHTYLIGSPLQGSLVLAHNGTGSGGFGIPEDAEVFPNQMPLFLQGVLDEAARLGVRPTTPGTPNFDAMIKAGPIKFTVSAGGELSCIPFSVGVTEIPHTIASGWADVLAAGEASIAGSAGQYSGLGISNQSGHYLPSPSSLDIAKGVFGTFGITF
jgi:hypothetical protein